MTTPIHFVPFPPTSFPFRDLLVLEHVSIADHHRICEIGVGAGETTARLARLCQGITGFEISEPTVEALRYLERRHPNLELVVADVTDDESVSDYQEQFDRLISCDTMEHVEDPAGFFRSLARLLRPGGEFAITFPNEPEDRMHGITRFDAPEDLAALAAAAGLRHIRIGSAQLTDHADRLADRFGWKPLRAARRVLEGGRSVLKGSNGSSNGHSDEAADPPQKFEDTNFFRNMALYRGLSPAVNLYWFGVLRMMASKGPSFEIDWNFADKPFTDCQVFMTGRRPTARERRQSAA